MKSRKQRGRLQKEIESVRLDLRETEGRLEKEIKEVEVRLVNAIHRQTLWVIGSVGLVIGFIRLLDWLLAKLPAAG